MRERTEFTSNDIEVPCKINSLSPSQHSSCLYQQPPGEPRLFTFPPPTHLESGRHVGFIVYILSHTHWLRPHLPVRFKDHERYQRDINGYYTSMSSRNACVCAELKCLYIYVCVTHSHCLQYMSTLRKGSYQQLFCRYYCAIDHFGITPLKVVSSQLTLMIQLHSF